MAHQDLGLGDSINCKNNPSFVLNQHPFTPTIKNKLFSSGHIWRVLQGTCTNIYVLQQEYLRLLLKKPIEMAIDFCPLVTLKDKEAILDFNLTSATFVRRII